MDFFRFIGFGLSLLMFGYSVPGFSEKRIVIDNPYEGIIWSSNGDSQAWERHKANFHTHTTESDGKLSPEEVIDSYYSKKYTILAITDHNACTWPWTIWGRDPDTLGMVAIAGNEFSDGHHRGSLFAAIDGNPGKDVGKTLDLIAKNDGLAMMNHPGRYSKSVRWYVRLYRNYPLLVGLEVFNQGNRYRKDRKIWDKILTKLMPERPVWGYSNDDMHKVKQLYKNYNVLFVESLTEDNVRLALKNGWSYFCYEPKGSGDAKAPVIESITVDTLSAAITIDARNHKKIQWISEGKKVAEGETIKCSEYFKYKSNPSYVRAKIKGADGETYTQPFGIRFVEPK